MTTVERTPFDGISGLAALIGRAGVGQAARCAVARGSRPREARTQPGEPGDGDEGGASTTPPRCGRRRAVDAGRARGATVDPSDFAGSGLPTPDRRRQQWIGVSLAMTSLVHWAIKGSIVVGLAAVQRSGATGATRFAIRAPPAPAASRESAAPAPWAGSAAWAVYNRPTAPTRDQIPPAPETVGYVCSGASTRRPPRGRRPRGSSQRSSASDRGGRLRRLGLTASSTRCSAPTPTPAASRAMRFGCPARGRPGDRSRARRRFSYVIRQGPIPGTPRTRPLLQATGPPSIASRSRQ